MLVEDLAERADMSANGVSQQLRVLRHLRLVARDGRRMLYRLHDEHLPELLGAIRHQLEHADRAGPTPATLTGRRPCRITHIATGTGTATGWSTLSIKRSRAGSGRSLVSLLDPRRTAGPQIVVFALSGSIALLADLIHNVGDALTAVPLGAAFLMRSFRAEKYAGYFVVATIFFSACVAFGESIDRLINPQDLTTSGARRGGRDRLPRQRGRRARPAAGRTAAESPALIADGYHARTDGIVSLAVVASAVFVALGVRIADPLIGMVVTAVILRITWQSWLTVRADPR